MLNQSLLIGNKNKVASQDTDGKLAVSAKMASEIIVFSKDNPLPPRSSADYQQRTNIAYTHAFPHLWTPYADGENVIFSYRNIFDQSFIISHTYDVSLGITFNIIDAAGGNSLLGSTYLARIDLGSIPASDGSDPQRMIIAADLSSTVTNVVAAVIPELRQPFPAFSISIAPIGVPTTGELQIMNTRRY